MLKLQAGQKPEQIIAATVKREHGAETTWQAARATYGTYRTELIKDNMNGMRHDWKGLRAQLATVVDQHPKIKVRIQAKQLMSGIDKVINRQDELVKRGLISVALPETPSSSQ